jgi:hypothetical protein
VAARLGRLARLLPLLLLLGATPSQAGLLAPLLGLMRPQLEQRLSQACTRWASGGDAALAQKLEQPCRDLARPTSRCLLEETERSGRSLGVVSELLAGRFGDDTEVVVKRCASRLLGLPQDSLQEVPLRQLAERFKPSGAR